MAGGLSALSECNLRKWRPPGGGIMWWVTWYDGYSLDLQTYVQVDLGVGGGGGTVMCAASIKAKP